MTRDEAIEVVGIIVARWPGSHWSVATMDAYCNALERFDCEITMKAVLRAEQELEFYPKIPVLREFIRIEKRLAEPEGPIERMLNDTPSVILPQWVKGWCVSRHRYGDFRVWHEQDPDSDDLMPREERDRYILEGQDLRIEDIFAHVVQ